MTAIPAEVLEALLHLPEGPTLDFKEEQYLFYSTDKARSDKAAVELVKDILTFANGWKTSDAHILIGVRENSGGRAVVTGVTEHLKDNDLQQLVNSKTNRPIAFGYVSATVDGKVIGVIRVAAKQRRPLFLKKKFGHLESGAVYVRRGSSAAVADPDEIAAMAVAEVSIHQQPTILLEWGDLKNNKPLGKVASLVSLQLIKRPPPPKAMRELMRTIERASLVKAVAFVPPRDMFKPTEKQMRAYRRELARLTPVALWASNAGSVLVADLRAVFEIRKLKGLTVTDSLPEEPRGKLEIPNFYAGHASRTSVREFDDRWEVAVRFGKIQPKADAWSDEFWIGTTESCELSVKIKLLADNLPSGLDVTLDLQVEARQRYFDEWSEAATKGASGEDEDADSLEEESMEDAADDDAPDEEDEKDGDGDSGDPSGGWHRD